MFTSSRNGGGGVMYAKNSISSYSPSLSMSNSRATSQESDLYSFSSDAKNGYRKLMSPLPSSRCSSVINTFSSVKYPLSTYKKSKTFKKLNVDDGIGNGTGELSSSHLSIKIAEFLKRTDHVTDEWKKLGRDEKKKTYVGKKIDDYLNGLKKYRSKSSLNDEKCDVDTKSTQHLEPKIIDTRANEQNKVLTWIEFTL